MVWSLIEYIDIDRKQGGYHRGIKETQGKKQAQRHIIIVEMEDTTITSSYHGARRLQQSDSSSGHPSAVDLDSVRRPYPAQARQTVKMSATSLAHLEAGQRQSSK